SQGLKDLDIRTVAVHPRDPKVLFAASERTLYKTSDGGAVWQQVLSVKGSENGIHFILIDSSDSSGVYVATDKGVKKSSDGGKRWSAFFKKAGPQAGRVYCLAQSAESPGKLWVGTGDGMFRVDSKTGRADLGPVLGGKSVYSIVPGNGGGAPSTVAVTDQGIYRNQKAEGDVSGWEKVYNIHRQENAGDSSDALLGQFNIEELSVAPFFSRAIYWEGQKQYLAAGKDGLFESAADGSAWKKGDDQNFAKEKANSVIASANTYYVATDRGVFKREPDGSGFQEFNRGLGPGKVRALGYSVYGDYLVAGTDRGIFKWTHPELDGSVKTEDKESRLKARDFLERFRGEPSIHEVQQAAIQFAEVHPRKIQEWRAAAARKAWMPKLSMGADLDKDQNVDLDRGGTNDPDRFIIGPDEERLNWSVSLNWDFGDLIWNGDQTSIDTRSKLMVELREDVLNEVTHLYFERRRLLAEMTMSPPRDLAVEVEKELRLEELTAGIDAMTGGYFSKRTERNPQASLTLKD
ncbi:MAG: hypothetical protein HYZ87_04115, partial [Candidatus Omnitrophica bacterium]|nr:hypothetical protein [Candidatus Omnitrophota bacterium]